MPVDYQKSTATNFHLQLLPVIYYRARIKSGPEASSNLIHLRDERRYPTSVWFARWTPLQYFRGTQFARHQSSETELFIVQKQTRRSFVSEGPWFFIISCKYLFIIIWHTRELRLSMVFSKLPKILFVIFLDIPGHHRRGISSFVA